MCCFNKLDSVRFSQIRMQCCRGRRSTRLFITQSVNKNYLSYYRQIINAKWKLVSLASVNLAARQFLAIAYFASLVTASDLAALTALYLLRENLYLFPLSDFAGQKTKVI